MALGKTTLRDALEFPGIHIEHFLSGKPDRIQELKDMLKNATGDRADLIRQQLVRELVAFRHGVSDDADDAIFAVMAHEAGHTLFRSNNLTMTWHFALQEHKVNYSDHALVSHYAGFNESELFSEVTSLLAQGREAEVPPNILNAYNQTIGVLTDPGG